MASFLFFQKRNDLKLFAVNEQRRQLMPEIIKTKKLTTTTVCKRLIERDYLYGGVAAKKRRSMMDLSFFFGEKTYVLTRQLRQQQQQPAVGCDVPPHARPVSVKLFDKRNLYKNGAIAIGNVYIY